MLFINSWKIVLFHVILHVTSAAIIKTSNNATTQYTLTLEPYSEECTEYSDPKILKLENYTFKQLNKNKIGLSSIINLNKTINTPIKVLAIIEKLQAGSYVYYMKIPYNNFCKDLNDKESIVYSYASKLKIYDCPIEKNLYQMNNFTIDIDDLDLGPEDVGKYRSKIIIRGYFDEENDFIYCHQFYSRIEPNRRN